MKQAVVSRGFSEFLHTRGTRLIARNSRAAEFNQAATDLAHRVLPGIPRPLEVRQRSGQDAGRKKFEDALTVHENSIHETRNKSVQDPLNYGIKINNRLAHLMVEQAAGDFPPTRQGEEVRQILTKIVDEELSKLKTTIDQNVDRINQMAKEKGVEMIMVKKKPSDM